MYAWPIMPISLKQKNWKDEIRFKTIIGKYNSYNDLTRELYGFWRRDVRIIIEDMGVDYALPSGSAYLKTLISVYDAEKKEFHNRSNSKYRFFGIEEEYSIITEYKVSSLTLGGIATKYGISENILEKILKKWEVPRYRNPRSH